MHPRYWSWSIARFALSVLALSAVGCVSTRPPTIAHVHIGHAITGVAVTPGQKGYVLEAEERAQKAYDLASKAMVESSLPDLKKDVDAVIQASSSDDDFGLKRSLIMASNHITFAATSDDASQNVRDSAPIFAQHITRVVERCDEIVLLGKDVDATSTMQEATSLTAEIRALTEQNINGEDAHGTGLVGGTPEEYGMRQLRQELQDMIARENPPYRTVDQYYLFNLIRLPNGKWIFDKLDRGGNTGGSGY
jgi:hypothetical protein